MTGQKADGSLLVGCVILAGGRSVRMGTDKALLTLDGRTYIERVAAEFSGFKERLLSGGGEALAHRIGFRYVPDEYAGCGPMGGLYSALRAADSRALFAAACDMPLFSRAAADFAISRLSPEDTGLVCVSPDGRIQPLCGVYTKRCLPALRRFLDSGQLKMLPLLEELGIKKLPVPPQTAGEECFINVNRPEDIPDRYGG